MKRFSTLIVLVLVVVIIALIGSRIDDQFIIAIQNSDLRENTEKFREVMNYISSYYVDTVGWDSLTETAIEGVLSDLDPHSVYINAGEAKLNEENFQGEYQGIGIQFDVIDGFLTVISPIPGSPSDKLGLMAGDRIVKIDDESVIGISRNDVPKKLKGPKGSSVRVSVMREGLSELLDFSIVRDTVPIVTIDTYFMTEDSTGYIFLTRFAKTTEEEFDAALALLEGAGLKRLILDLRWNAGGYLDQAVKVAARFLHGKKRIVYTQGRLKEFNDEYYTDTFGPRKVRDIPLIILINHGSASAAEIVAGAIQDYDRGVLIGTTSFGKGLVQREFPLSDSSQVRLTISKYYTPSGRLIQRPYKGKDLEYYYDEWLDSTKIEVETDTVLAERPVFYTSLGRTVYGGGGITPDTIVVLDDMYRAALIQRLAQKRVFFEFATRFAAKNQHLGRSFDDFRRSFRVNSSMLQEFKQEAREKDIQFDEKSFSESVVYIKTRIRGEIARSFWGTDKYRRIMLEIDNQYHTAFEIFPYTLQILTSASRSRIETN